ncbi:sulfurtransferase complex subunit TusB [Enterovibrio nigricans]|uniref:tRNA 2-thiouridine synthesizing protein B n=1 Tax=Enterovibrio nigricans DSM 22720 TaxID=1121868 RepID=A0A1T4U874_9GAMM|nr:sulfurtransferase complex subunit TusB [Enterovibrio nigricans]PKF51512.1 sulfurtransferase complex subunit TusB [Enterovibrio nigricans]SKA48955.1 tRNA 2-thiouridine synthesizing protein B [Enterovibrio nigricans DSM 22720]
MLHTVNSSPFSTSSLSLCLRYAERHCEILLIEDAVVAAISGGEWQQKLAASGHRIYVLKDDVIARGLLEKIEHPCEVIEMKDFVELTERHVTQMKW